MINFGGMEGNHDNVNVRIGHWKVNIERVRPSVNLEETKWEKIFSPMVQRHLKKLFEEYEEEASFENFVFSNATVKVVEIEEDKIKAWLCNQEKVFEVILNYKLMYEHQRAEAVLNSPSFKIEYISNSPDVFYEKEAVLLKN